MKDVELFKLGENDAVDLGDDGDGEASIQEEA
jgi:recombination protein RecA